MKFFTKIVIITAMLFISGCGNTFVFPNEEDFNLKATVNKESLTIGEELTVNATFKNLTNRDYELGSSATFSTSGLMHINLYELDEEEMIMVGAIRFVTVNGEEEITEQRNFQMDKKGKFKIVVLSTFDITNSKTKEKRAYQMKTDTIYIEVK